MANVIRLANKIDFNLQVTIHLLEKMRRVPDLISIISARDYKRFKDTEIYTTFNQRGWLKRDFTTQARGRKSDASGVMEL